MYSGGGRDLCSVVFSSCFTFTGTRLLSLQPAECVINFFVHDDLDVKPTASAFTVVGSLRSPNGRANTNLFGSIAVIDDKVTVGPEVNSTEIARGRGFYVFDHLQTDTTGLEFVLTLIFNNQSGYEDGSTLVFRGYDNIMAVYRELAILGGTGTFRLARGWAGILTYQLIGGAAILNMTGYVYYGCNYGTIGVNSGPYQIAPSFPTVLTIVLCTIFLLGHHRRPFQ